MKMTISRHLLSIPLLLRNTQFRLNSVAMVVFLAVLAWAHSSHAASAYRTMKDAQEGYTPPAFLTRHTEGASQRTPQQTGDAADPTEQTRESIRKQLQPMAAALDEIGKAQGLSAFFGPAYQATAENLAGTAQDDTATAALLEKEFSLKELVALAVLRDPAVRAAKKEVAAARAAFDQVAGLDEVILAYQGVTRGVTPGAGPGAVKGDIRQLWPPPGRIALKGRIAAADVAMAVTREGIAEKKTATLAAQGFWDFALVDETLTVTRETLAALNRLRDVATSLYNSGRAGFQDIARINIRVALLRENLTTLKEDRKTVSVRLAEILNLPPGIPVGKGKVPAESKKIPAPETVYAQALESRQELTLVRQKIEKLTHMLALSESMTDAPFTLGFSYFDNNIAGSLGSDSLQGNFPERTMAGMKNGQPARAFNAAAQPFLEQTRQTLSGLKETLKAREKAAVRMVREAWAALDKNLREAALYETQILSLTRSALDSATREYEAGGIGFSDAIAAYTDWLNARLELAKRRAGTGKSRARLEQMTGKTLSF